MNFETEIRDYYLVFQKDCEGRGHFVFIVENEDTAIQFCKDNNNFYYMSRDRYFELLKENK